MEILPVNDQDVALHEFVNKDDKLAFHSCLQHNLEETRNKLVEEAEVLQVKEDDLIHKSGPMHAGKHENNKRLICKAI